LTVVVLYTHTHTHTLHTGPAQKKIPHTIMIWNLDRARMKPPPPPFDLQQAGLVPQTNGTAAPVSV